MKRVLKVLRKVLWILPAGFLLYFNPITGKETPKNAHFAPSSILKIHYSVRCTGAYGMVGGSISLHDRILRINLPEGQSEISYLVPNSASEKVNLKLDSVPDCSATVYSLEQSEPNLHESSIQQLAIEHAPFLVVRPEQFQNSKTDVPSLLAYSVFKESNGSFRLRYTLFMTDEDSLHTSDEEDFQMARYGRRTDVEWLYEVEFDAWGEITHRRYQGGVLFGIGHLSWDFQGKFLPDSQHPVLYNIADHNVFSDRVPASIQSKKPIGYAFYPSEEIPFPKAREWAMLHHPWLYWQSDLELAREGKLSVPSDHYLYVLLQGKMDRGSIQAKLNLADGSTRLSGNGKGDLDRLGEDLWGLESLSAIPLSPEEWKNASQLGANLTLESTSFPGARAEIHSLRFFRLLRHDRSYSLQEVSSNFECTLDHSRPSCVLKPNAPGISMREQKWTGL